MTRKHDVQEADRSHHGSQHRQHYSERQAAVTPYSQLGRNFCRSPRIQHEAQPSQVHICNLLRPILRVPCDPMRNRGSSKADQSDLGNKSPTTLKEIRSLTGRAAVLNRFLSRSTDRCKPFFKAIKNTQKDK